MILYTITLLMDEYIQHDSRKVVGTYGKGWKHERANPRIEIIAGVRAVVPEG